MAIVGISGSPIIGGNVDRMTQRMLELSCKETKFINLSKLKFFPCRACAHLCATTAMCGIKDELLTNYKKKWVIDLWSFESPRHHGDMTAWLYSFFSRLWCFLHDNHTLKNKPVIFISVGCGGVSVGRETFRHSMIKEHEFNVLGQLYFTSYVFPCLSCGMGLECRNEHGGLWNYLGKDEDALKNYKITADKFKRWEDDINIVNEVKKYGEILSSIHIMT